MPKLNRLTTDKPNGNYQNLHNMTLVKDKEVYLRDWNGEGDISLVDFCKVECKKKCFIDIEENDPAAFGGYIMDCDCMVSWFYNLAVGHGELRETLKEFEDREEKRNAKAD